jgi:hypothetical protein
MNWKRRSVLQALGCLSFGCVLVACSPADEAGFETPDEVETARAIRTVAQRFLQSPPADYASALPPDLRGSVPVDIGEPELDSLGHVPYLMPWWLIVEGDQAELRYTPPDAVHANFRVWIQLDLERVNGEWVIASPKLGSGIACRLRR